VSPTSSSSQPEPQRSNLITALVAGALIALVAANIYLYVQVDHVRGDMAKLRESLMTEMSNLRDASSVTTSSQMRHIETLKEELEAAREQARTAASQGKAEAQAYANQLAKQLEAEQAKVAQQMGAELNSVKSDVKQVASNADAKIAGVSNDVGTVKSQVSQTQEQLEKTISELKSVKGDLGVQSGLIATNASELAALKLRGERNYVDVRLPKTKQRQRFADIMLLLKKTDPKRNRYTVEVMADDKITEKKDRNINEPVQFYTSKGGHIPYELVINQVQKDLIIGYLSIPKEQVAR
jgi:hypothetical protein